MMFQKIEGIPLWMKLFAQNIESQAKSKIQKSNAWDSDFDDADHDYDSDSKRLQIQFIKRIQDVVKKK